MIDEPYKDIACLALTERPGSEERFLSRVKETAHDLESYLRWQTPYEVDITSYVALVDDTALYGLATPDSKLAELSGEHLYYALFGVPVSRCGRAWPDTNKMAMLSPGDKRCTRHEAGHAVFGGEHNVTGTVGEYEENYGGPTVMGNGSQLGAVNLDFAKLVPDEMKAYGGGHYYLVEPAVRDRAVLPGEVKVIYLDDGSRWWAISYFEGKIRVDTSRGPTKREPPWAGIHSHVSLMPGDSWRDVVFVQKWHGRAEVTIGNSSHVPPPRIQASPDRPIEPGHFMPKATHQGFQLFIKDGRAHIYWFTHNSAGPFWMVGDGPIERDVAHLTLYAVENGELRHVGGGLLWMEGEGVFHYWTDLSDYQWPGRGRMVFKRLIDPVPHPVYGAYETKEREGLTIHKTVIHDEEGKAHEWVVGVWWLRGMWRYMEGPFRGVLTLYKIKGGWPDTVTDSTVERWGEAKVNRHWLRYKRDAWSDYKGVPLERLI